MTRRGKPPRTHGPSWLRRGPAPRTCGRCKGEGYEPPPAEDGECCYLCDGHGVL